LQDGEGIWDKGRFNEHWGEGVWMQWSQREEEPEASTAPPRSCWEGQQKNRMAPGDRVWPGRDYRWS
jgi:hypothetical protein